MASLISVRTYIDFCSSLDSYQRKYSGVELLEEYSLGITEEAGEVSGKVKKLRRDSGNRMTLQIGGALLSECGDTLWYVTRYHVHWLAWKQRSSLWFETMLGPEFNGFETIPNRFTLKELSRRLARQAARFTVPECITEDDFRGIYRTLATIAHKCDVFLHGGSALQLAAQVNVVKLRSREKRGVLGGSGDNR